MDYQGTVAADGSELKLEEHSRANDSRGTLVLHFGAVMGSCSRPLHEPAPRSVTSAAAEEQDMPEGMLTLVAPDLAIGDISLSGPGSLAKEVVRQKIVNKASDLEVCYRNMMGSYSAAVGDEKVSFVVGADGLVGVPRRTGGTLDLTIINTCVVRTYAGLRFPPPKGGEVHVVSTVTFRYTGGPRR